MSLSLHQLGCESIGFYLLVFRAIQRALLSEKDKGHIHKDIDGASLL